MKSGCLAWGPAALAVACAVVWVACGGSGGGGAGGEGGTAGSGGDGGGGGTGGQHPLCSAEPTYADFAAPLVEAYCLACHSASRTGPARNDAPPGVNFDTEADLVFHESAIRQQVDAGLMPKNGPPLEACLRTRLAAYFDAIACTPDCTGRMCGDDGCGGTCGACADGTTCDGGTCVCQPDCTGRTCGDDGCGGSCGTCADGSACDGGTCVCQPDCTGRTCGDDGCGGSCGTCADGTACDGGSCVCQPDCTGRTCGDDGCGGSCGACADGTVCTDGACVDTCTETCGDRTCGTVCGESCGTCAGSDRCVDGHCTCVPQCTGRTCGSDGCGGTCGSCGPGTSCNAAGQCICQRTCAPGAQCGDDGCGGTCGTCGAGMVCEAGNVCDWDPGVRFSSDVFPILQRACSSCHGGTFPQNGLALDTKANAIATLVNAPASGCPGRTRVVPGAPASSYVVAKVQGAAGICGARMPYQGVPLSAAEIGTIQAWIAGGALDD